MSAVTRADLTISDRWPWCDVEAYVVPAGTMDVDWRVVVTGRFCDGRRFDKLFIYEEGEPQLPDLKLCMNIFRKFHPPRQEWTLRLSYDAG